MSDEPRPTEASSEGSQDPTEAPRPAWEREPARPEWQEAVADPLVEALRAELGAAILSARCFAGDLCLGLASEGLELVARVLKEKHGFTYLIDICGVDYPRRTPRFEVVYHLHSFAANRRLRLKVAAAEGAPVPTVTGVWRAANWPEREVYDMYGVRFSSHPDMTRILLWEGFNGHPLRKDFPVEGIDTGAAIHPEPNPDGTDPVAGKGTARKPTAPAVPNAGER